MRIKQLRDLKVPDFAIALPARKVTGAFEKRAPGQNLSLEISTFNFQRPDTPQRCPLLRTCT